MKIYYVHQYYRTPSEGGAIRSFHLAQGLAKAGIAVEIITGHDQKNYSRRWDGQVKVHLVPVSYDNNLSTFKRILAFLKFVRMAKKLILRMEKPDLFYISSTPLTTGFIGLWAKKKWGIPYVFEVRDLWPDAPIQIKGIKNSLIKKLLYRWEKNIYDGASKIVALSPGIKAAISEKCQGKDIALIPNFSDTEFFQPQNPGALKEADQQNPLAIGYAGAIGEVNGLNQFLELAGQAQASGKSWQFSLMGKGNRVDNLKKSKEIKGLKNLHFIPFGDKGMVRNFMGGMDLIYLSFIPLPVLETGSPNKFFDALAMGKPVILNFKGWIWDIVRSHEIGLFHDVNCHEKVLMEIQEWINQGDKLSLAGEKARTLAEEKFSKELAIEKLLEILKLSHDSKKVLSGFIS
ncbi:MAG: glycosyltransferase family 4 protein [Cyclobacteriaceae bacterium]